MKHKKDFYVNLLVFIGSFISITAGTLMVVLLDSNRLIALGGLLICLGGCAFCFGLIRAVSLRSIRKEEAKKNLAEKRESEKSFNTTLKRESEKLISDALKAFERNTDYPETNTIKVVNAGVEFFAEGRYVCEKDFKNVRGYHFAFEISSTGLKRESKDRSYLEDNGVLIAAGYHDGEALEEYANDNGIILKDAINNLVGQTITVKPDKGYNLNIWTAEGDEINFGFVKILKCENDVLTVYFLLDVPYGLDDRVEGTVELKKDTVEDTRDINSLITKIKRKHYNTIDVSGEEVQAIKEANPFLPESYITFLKEIGFADLDWIDVGRNNNTTTNLNDDEVGYINDILADYDGTKTEDFYFIAVDNGGSYYAFSRKPDDEKVYILSDDASDIDSYESFDEFLYEILNVD